jgi:hypothetical protein
LFGPSLARNQESNCELILVFGAKMLDFGLAKLKQEAAPAPSLWQRPIK